MSAFFENVMLLYSREREQITYIYYQTYPVSLSTACYSNKYFNNRNTIRREEQITETIQNARSMIYRRTLL